MVQGQIDTIALGVRNQSDTSVVENLFNAFSIEAPKDKIKILQAAMYADEVFYGSNLTEKEKLEIEMDTFVKGDWR